MWPHYLLLLLAGAGSPSAVGLPAAAAFVERALASPALRPHMLSRPRGGVHEFTFALYAVGESDLCAPGVRGCTQRSGGLSNLVSGMLELGVANGFDPFGFEAMALDAPTRRTLASLGWPVSHYPLQQLACFQVPGCENNMTAEQYSRLAIFWEANVYSEIQFAEWGNFMTLLRPAAPCPWENCSGYPAPGSPQPGAGNVNWWHDQFPLSLCNATVCDAAPDNPSNKCCSTGKGNITNDTRFELHYTQAATPTVTTLSPWPSPFTV